MAPRSTTEHHGAFEQYCEAIFELHEDELDVIQARIADRLDVSPPAVSEMIKRMEAGGLVLLGGNITLTNKGTALAEQGGSSSPARRAFPHRCLKAVMGRRAP